jgi:hypothetical protein
MRKRRLRLVLYAAMGIMAVLLFEIRVRAHSEGALDPGQPLVTEDGVSVPFMDSSAGGTTEPLQAPLPGASIALLFKTVPEGGMILASGTVPVPGREYCLCLVPHGLYTAADVATPTPSPLQTAMSSRHDDDDFRRHHHRPTPTPTLCPSETPTPTPTRAPTSTPTPTPTVTSGGPDVSISASCTPDAQGTFTITDTGGSMTSPGTWTLTLNGTPIATNTFQLLAGASTSVNTSGLFGTLEMIVSGGGIPAAVSASTFCMSPTPTPTPVPPTFSLSAQCTPDAQGTFTITDIGSSMTSPGTWTLDLNGTPVATNTFQLLSGASTSVSTSGLFGTLDLIVSGGGSTGTVTVSTFCMSPTPTPTPVPPTFSLSAQCTPDAQGTFTITNTGGSMTSPGTWTLDLNGTPIATNTFQLLSGGSTSVNTSGLFGTLDLFVSGGASTGTVTVSTFCMSPTPTPTPVPPTFSITAACTADSNGTFTITDTGTAMTSPGTWTLTQDGTPLATNTFQLLNGQSITVNTSGLSGSLELTATGGGSVGSVSATTTCPGTAALAVAQLQSGTPGPGTVTTTLSGPGRVWVSPPPYAGSSAAPVACVQSVVIKPDRTTFSAVAIAAPGPGKYDLLLLDGPCGAAGTPILAMDGVGEVRSNATTNPVAVEHP